MAGWGDKGNKGRRKSSFWTLLQNDPYLRRMLRAYVKRHPNSQRGIARDLGLHMDRLNHYLNNKPTRRLNDLNILSLADYLGLKISIKVELKDEEEGKQAK